MDNYGQIGANETWVIFKLQKVQTITLELVLME